MERQEDQRPGAGASPEPTSPPPSPWKDGHVKKRQCDRCMRPTPTLSRGLQRAASVRRNCMPRRRTKLTPGGTPGCRWSRQSRNCSSATSIFFIRGRRWRSSPVASGSCSKMLIVGGEPSADAQARSDRLQPPRHRAGDRSSTWGVHDQLLRRIVAKRELDGERLVLVARRRGGRVRVEVLQPIGATPASASRSPSRGRGPSVRARSVVASPLMPKPATSA